MRTDTANAIHLEDYSPTPYLIETVELDICLSPQATQVHARLALRRREGTAPGAPLHLDGDGLTLEGFSVNGLPAVQDSFTAAPNELVLHTPPLEAFTLDIHTRLNPDENTALSGLYRSSGIYCTQCEAEGFRRITYFLDRPDVLSIYTTRIEARKADAPILLGNGNPVEAGDIEGTDRHFAIWHDPHPKPSYLFALVGGHLTHLADSFTTQSGQQVALKIHVEPGKENRCAWAMDCLKRSMKWDEDVFGREYDLDVFNIVAVSDFNAGAMENKGLNIFNDKYVLADPDTATDEDHANIEAVIAHEYFHNWTGNRITCRDWFQLCLKEGLTVFRDQEFSSDMRSRPVKRIADVRMLRSHQFPEDAGPLAHPVRPRSYVEINNFYTATVYEKGAEVVRMLKTLLGDEGFSAGLDLYFNRHDGDATTIEAFLACFAEATGHNLDQFSLWYEQAGTPQVRVSSAHDPATATLTLEVSQSISPLPNQDMTEPALIPLRFGLLGPQGEEVVPASISGIRHQDDVLILDKERHTVSFTGLPSRPTLSLLRGFSAPVHLQTDQSDDELLFLARHDTDAFNRWQTLQTLATRELVRLSQKARSGLTLDPDDSLADIYGQLLADESLSPAFRALAVHLPGVADLSRDIGKDVDPEALHTARQGLRQHIGKTHRDMLPELYQAHVLDAPYSPGAKAAGKRALTAQILSFMALSGEKSSHEKIQTAFDTADNMTTRLSALTLLVHDNLPGAEEALAAFRKRYEDTALAMDKWFTVQATAPVADGLERVQALSAHPLFDMANPNRMRALIHAFATGNQTQFTRADGKGFDFVADCVLLLDSRNPQVAARLLTCFRSWRALEQERRNLAKQALVRISTSNGLSRDCRDIVDRSLQ